MIKLLYALIFTLLFSSQLFADCPPVSLSPRELPSALLNRNYEYSIPVYGGTAPFEVRIVEGILPKGISLSKEGILSGIPKSSGEFRLVIFASDSCAKVQEARAAYTLFVANTPADVKPVISKNEKIKLSASASFSGITIENKATSQITVKHTLSAVPEETALITSPGISFIVDGSVEKSLSIPLEALLINGKGEIDEKIDIPRDVIRSATRGSGTILINRPFICKGTTASSLLKVKTGK